MNDDEFRRRHPFPFIINPFEDQRVTSYNQSGGVTAHTVNIGQQQRELQEVHKVQLLGMLPPDKTVEVVTGFGDSESIKLGQQIMDFLRGKGFKVGNSQVVWGTPPAGVKVNRREKYTEVVVGLPE